MQVRLADGKHGNIIAACAVPGLAASNLQATTSDHGGGAGLGLIMKFSQSAEDGSLPLLHCTVGQDVQSGDLWVRLCPLPALNTPCHVNTVHGM
jgi:hypothetical protein